MNQNAFLVYALCSLVAIVLTTASCPGLDLNNVKEVALAIRPPPAPQDIILVEYIIPGIDSGLGMKLFGSMSNESRNILAVFQVQENGTVNYLLSGRHFSNLVSGVIHNKVLYFSYGWGSGITSASFGVITKSLSGLNRIDSRKYFGQDRHEYFYIGIQDDAPVLMAGQYAGFNMCEKPRTIGRIVITEKNALEVVGMDGKNIVGVEFEGLEIDEVKHKMPRPSP